MSNNEIDWPAGFERTDPRNQERNNRFDKSLRQSIDDLADELERLDVENWRLSTGAEHQKRNPRYPYANASPDDPGAVVRWTMDGEQYAVACDRYSRLRDNIRTLCLYIHEKRMMENRPVETGESEFANARLPPGDEDAETVVAEQPPSSVLGVSRDASRTEIIDAYRDRVKEAHPDNGGSGDEFTRVQEAKEKLMERTASAGESDQ